MVFLARISIKWLDIAFKNFFKGLVKFPKFKSTKRTNSVSISQHFRIEGNKIKTPKLCSVCRYKNENFKLSDRNWKCPNCGTEHDRDYNATLNWIREGLKLINGLLTLRAVGLGQSELMPVKSANALIEAGSSSFQ